MGLENRIVYNLVDVVEGNCQHEAGPDQDKRYPNLCLTAVGTDQGQDKLSTPAQMVKLVE